MLSATDREHALHIDKIICRSDDIYKPCLVLDLCPHNPFTGDMPLIFQDASVSRLRSEPCKAPLFFLDVKDFN